MLLIDRLNTKELMLRKKLNLEEGHSGVLCDIGVVETTDHLFFQCLFASSHWQKIGVTRDHKLDISDMLARAKQLFPSPT
jgi:hypothetical protein